MTEELSSEAQGPNTVPDRPPNGNEYLEGLRDGREVWIYGERVKDVTTHPAFRNSARSVARLYDLLYDPAAAPVVTTPTDTGNGGITHPFYKVARTRDDLRASRDAIELWQQSGYGMMGRTPEYKASLITALGGEPEFLGEYADNARRWYRESQERVLFHGHAVIHPPVDRNRAPDEVQDVYVHVESTNDNGVVVSGAKVVATGTPIAQYCFVSHLGVPLADDNYAITFISPLAGKGIKMISRHSYEAAAARAASPFDYPLSSRLDENDAILVYDQALIPWENVLMFDAQKLIDFDYNSGWQSRAIFQASTRLGVKLDFIVGVLSHALEITGASVFRGVQAGLGEVISIRHVVTALRDGMIERAEPGWGGTLNPNTAYALAYASTAPAMYRRMREIIHTIVASGLIYLNSNAIDFETPELRPYLDRFLRGSNGKTALDRSRTMKMLWDATTSEFGARQELYELNYFGQPELNFIRGQEQAQIDGMLGHARDLASKAMSEYDLSGWTAKDLINPDDVNFIRGR